MAQINTNMIMNQMNDFNSSLATMEGQADVIFRSAKEILNELIEGIKCLDQSVANSGGEQVDVDELNELKAKMRDSVYKEVDSLRNSLKTLIEIILDGSGFVNKEQQVRRRLMENPEEFDMKELKKLLGEKPDAKHFKVEDHPKYRELLELIEDAKNGVSSDSGDVDLVVDEPVNQIVKCPITRMPIKELAKNKKCDHVYERSAILAYMKSRPNRKCPYAGCTQQILLDR